jgi:hypothetical protein
VLHDGLAGRRVTTGQASQVSADSCHPIIIWITILRTSQDTALKLDSPIAPDHGTSLQLPDGELQDRCNYPAFFLRGIGSALLQR